MSKLLTDVAGRLQWMDSNKHRSSGRRRLARHVRLRASAEEGAVGARLINSALLKASKAEPAFIPLATVPLQDGKPRPQVLEEAHRPGFKGVMIGTQPKGKGGVLDDPSLDPFWEAANELGRSSSCIRCSTAATTAFTTTEWRTPSAASRTR